MSAKRKKRSTFGIAALLLAVVLIVIAFLAVVVKCAKDDGSEDDPPIGKDPEVVVELDKSSIVFGGGAEASVPPAGPQDPDPDPDPGKADFTLSAEELLYVPGGEAGATLTATKAGVTWTAEWEDPASGWAAGKAVTDYVRLIPAGGTLNIRYLAPFGERVKIVCSDGSGSRECLCGCLKTVESFQGYFRTWNVVRANSYFGYDTFTIAGPYLMIDENFERENWGYTVEKAGYYPYTEEQKLTWGIRKSTYRLTEEFIASFRGYAEEQGEADEEVLAQLAGLSADAETPVLVELQEDGSAHTVFCGCYIGMDSMLFPPLTEGLSEGAAKKMYKLFGGWHDAHGDEVDVIEAIYRFTGSVQDCELKVRQRVHCGRERPEEYGGAEIGSR